MAIFWLGGHTAPYCEASNALTFIALTHFLSWACALPNYLLWILPKYHTVWKFKKISNILIFMSNQCSMLKFTKVNFTKNLTYTENFLHFHAVPLFDDFDDDDGDAAVEEDSDDNAVVSMMPKGREQVLRSAQGVLEVQFYIVICFVQREGRNRGKVCTTNHIAL